MNPLMMLGNNNMMMQAFGAMMRGESPQQFLKNLANTTPQLQGLDLDNLEGTAKSLCDKNNIDMNRRSNVTVAGNIDSSANVGLYAGADESGVLSNLNADLKSGAYNYSVIAITVPRVNYGITADKGTVNVSGTVRSDKDINVIASGGKEEIVKDESLWNWALGGASTDKKFLTSDAVVAEESSADMKKSTVNVIGSLIAGTADPVNLTISGSVADGLRYTADDNITNQRIVQGTTKGTFDYASTLGERLNELNKLIAAYNGDSTKMADYIADPCCMSAGLALIPISLQHCLGSLV